MNVCNPSCEVSTPNSEMSTISPNTFCAHSGQNGFTFYNENYIFHSDANFICQESVQSSAEKMTSENQGNQEIKKNQFGKEKISDSDSMPFPPTKPKSESADQALFSGKNSSKQPKIKKDKSFQNHQNSDVEQYFPETDKKKLPPTLYQQNQNRNVIPNQINQILSFIQKKNKSGHIVDRLFKKFSHPSEFTPKRFYLYQSLLKNKIGHYTNEKSLKNVTELYEPKCQIYSESEQRYYNKLCRVLIRHFLFEESIFMILTSKRMKKEKKRDHLRAKRSVTEQVINILRGF